MALRTMTTMLPIAAVTMIPVVTRVSTWDGTDEHTNAATKTTSPTQDMVFDIAPSSCRSWFWRHVGRVSEHVAALVKAKTVPFRTILRKSL